MARKVTLPRSPRSGVKRFEVIGAGPTIYKVKPWAHQALAYDFVKKRPGALLFCGMGTGKSRVVIDLINNDYSLKRVLIVCPLSVCAAWELQFQKFSCRHTNVVILDKGSVPARAIKADKALREAKISDRAVVFVINYDSFWRPAFAKFCLSAKFDLIVADECHRLKSPGGKASRFAARRGRCCRKRLGLSGTPAANSPLDIYGQFRFIDPSIFGTSYTRFKNRYGVWGGFQGYQLIGLQNEKEFNERFYKITFRADSEDVLDLPDVQHVEIPLEMSPATLRVYRELEQEFIAGVEDGTVTVSNALTKLLRLQQVTSGHIQLDDEEGIRVLH
jgi:SNF2 family DNA or RNA helicase